MFRRLIDLSRVPASSVCCYTSATFVRPSRNVIKMSQNFAKDHQMCNRKISSSAIQFNKDGDHTPKSSDTSEQLQSSEKSNQSSNNHEDGPEPNESDLKHDPDVRSILQQIGDDFADKKPSSSSRKSSSSSTTWEPGTSHSGDNSESNSTDETKLNDMISTENDKIGITSFESQQDDNAPTNKDEPGNQNSNKKKNLQDVLAEIYREEAEANEQKISTIDHQKYRDADSLIIYDVDEERQILRRAYEKGGDQALQEKAELLSGSKQKTLARAQRRARYKDLFPMNDEGEYVLNLQGLVTILKQDRVQDLAVIAIEKEKNYAQHLIVGTGRNARHLMAVMETVRSIYKDLTTVDSSKMPLIEGAQDKGKSGWLALDLGSIVLHLLTQETREYYDIETLWTVGPEFDELTRAMNEKDQLQQLMADSASLLAEFQPIEEEDQGEPNQTSNKQR